MHTQHHLCSRANEITPFGRCCYLKKAVSDNCNALSEELAMTSPDITHLVYTKLVVYGKPFTLDGFYFDFDQVPKIVIIIIIIMGFCV